jgi:hypothetical protein
MLQTVGACTTFPSVFVLPGLHGSGSSTWGGQRMAAMGTGKSSKEDAASDASELQNKLSEAKHTEAKLHVQV